MHTAQEIATLALTVAAVLGLVAIVGLCAVGYGVLRRLVEVLGETDALLRSVRTAFVALPAPTQSAATSLAHTAQRADDVATAVADAAQRLLFLESAAEDQVARMLFGILSLLEGLQAVIARLARGGEPPNPADASTAPAAHHGTGEGEAADVG